MDVKTRALRTLCASLPLAGVLALSACSAGSTSATADDPPASRAADHPARADQDGDVRVLRPGAPGEEAEEGPVDLPDAEHNAADVEYMTMMVPHHRQALVMSDLARTRAEDPAVRRIAARIRAAQAPEIQYMGDWLTQRGEAVPAPEDDRVDSGMAMGMGEAMEMGMLDADGLEALVDAEGEEFDRLYLEGMIGHHQGAIDMSEDVGSYGVDLEVAQLSADVNVGQTAEINRMQDILDRI